MSSNDVSSPAVRHKQPCPVVIPAGKAAVSKAPSQTHVKLRSAVTGTRYALPNVGTQPDFLVPVKAFFIQEIVGQHLVLLKEVPEGGYCYEKISGEVIFSGAPATAVMDSQNKIRTHGHLDDPEVLDESGFVNVYCSMIRLHEEFDDIPCMDLSNIPTPPTP